MDIKAEKKGGLAGIFALCPGAHVAALLGAVMIALHLLTRGNHALMLRLSQSVVRPVHRALALLCSNWRFSTAELLIAIFCFNIVVYIISRIIRIAKSKQWLREVYITIVNLLSALLLVYAGFCLLWGVYYYGDDFTTANGLEDSPVSTQELAQVTEYFAGKLNEYGELVERDADGLYDADRLAILNRSSELFANTERSYPGLAGPAIDAKGVYFSRVMSYLDFTGFFFPFTGEANVNTDFPPAMFAATVAHELSHQRGVAKEQEANFTAVLACLNYGDVDYCYSACMLAYTHLGNALYSADYQAWERIYMGLSRDVLKDMRDNSSYWKQFETPVQTVSNSVYESFLYSYDQDLGLRSYGACVDLLVNYYIDEANS